MKAVIRYDTGLNEIVALCHCRVFPPSIRISFPGDQTDDVVFQRDGELPFGTPLYVQRPAAPKRVA